MRVTMSHPDSYWISILCPGSTVFLMNTDGHIDKSSVSCVQDADFRVEGVNTPFSNATGSNDDGIRALPDCHELREAYSSQWQRGYLAKQDFAWLTDTEIRYMHTGFKLGTLPDDYRPAASLVVEDIRSVRAYMQKIDFGQLSEDQVSYILAGLRIARSRNQEKIDDGTKQS